MSRLVEKQGGQALSAPSMKEVPLAAQQQALAFCDVLSRRECDILVLLTGVGARLLHDALRTRLDGPPLDEYFADLHIYCRGPKPLAVCKEFGWVPAGVAPEPNTSAELLELIARQEALAGKRVFVQEYGRSSPELQRGLEAQGAEVRSIGVYAWTLPDDTGPLERAVQVLCEGQADAIAFTSAQQLEHLLMIARTLGLEEALIERLKRDVVVASIGPVTTEALLGHGITPTTTPEHPKMGQLISHLAREWPRLSRRER
jgi:uroporphyrinogen-III synthase